MQVAQRKQPNTMIKRFMDSGFYLPAFCGANNLIKFHTLQPLGNAFRKRRILGIKFNLIPSSVVWGSLTLSLLIWLWVIGLQIQSTCHVIIILEQSIPYLRRKPALFARLALSYGVRSGERLDQDDRCFHPIVQLLFLNASAGFCCEYYYWQ